ncbi:MAG: hypothetical protein KY464_16360, partial [Gemmatimonadetes bacterium]|nr:hypothetical protein [Gemmatimonadota bacterium]
MSRKWKLPIGARPDGEGISFRVWAPGTERVDVVVYGPDAEMNYPLQPESDGYFAGRVERL